MGFCLIGLGFNLTGLGSNQTGLGFCLNGFGSQLASFGSCLSGLGFSLTSLSFWFTNKVLNCLVVLIVWVRKIRILVVFTFSFFYVELWILVTVMGIRTVLAKAVKRKWPSQ